jgi:hypothetical protein
MKAETRWFNSERDRLAVSFFPEFLTLNYILFVQ